MNPAEMPRENEQNTAENEPLSDYTEDEAQEKMETELKILSVSSAITDALCMRHPNLSRAKCESLQKAWNGRRAQSARVKSQLKELRELKSKMKKKERNPPRRATPMPETPKPQSFGFDFSGCF
jgi:hypothetical protein